MTLRTLALALICLFAIPSASALAADPVLDNEEKALCKLVNTYRAQNGVPALKLSVSLTKASRWMSADMATRNYFSHTDSLGRSYSRRISDFGYTGAYKAENIAAGSNYASATFNQWKNSATHRKTMLSSTYKVMGIGRGYYAYSTYKMYWTMDFGSATDRTMAC